MLQRMESIKSKQDIIHFTVRFQLIRQLKAYGLDPNDWKFESLSLENSNNIGHGEISHREDSNLRIKGTVIKNKKYFKNLVQWHWRDMAWDI